MPTDAAPSARHVIVTGGAKGLGLAIAKVFAAAGDRPILIDVDGAALAEAVAELPGAVPIVADLRSQAGARMGFAKAVETTGAIDVLINNAGIYPRTPILDLDDEALDLVFDANVRSMVHMTIAAARHMRPRKSGRIVSIASIDAYIPYAKNAHYAASKAAVISFTKSFAQELAPDGVLVNAVSPGPIDTPNLRALGLYEDLAKSLPLGRVADPSDIAEVVRFLASPDNRYMTGETVIASGGALMV